MSEFDPFAAIIDFENGDLSDEDILKLFSYLVQTGMAWTLQGFYGRIARDLIEAGVLARDGTIIPEGAAEWKENL